MLIHLYKPNLVFFFLVRRGVGLTAGNSQSLRVYLPLSRKVIHLHGKAAQAVYVTSSYCIEKLTDCSELSLLSLPHRYWMIFALNSVTGTVCRCHWSLEVINLGLFLLSCWGLSFETLYIEAKEGCRCCVGKGWLFSLTSQIMVKSGEILLIHTVTTS